MLYLLCTWIAGAVKLRRRILGLVPALMRMVSQRREIEGLYFDNDDARED